MGALSSLVTAGEGDGATEELEEDAARFAAIPAMRKPPGASWLDGWGGIVCRSTCLEEGHLGGG